MSEDPTVQALPLWLCSRKDLTWVQAVEKALNTGAE